MKRSIVLFAAVVFSFIFITPVSAQNQKDFRFLAADKSLVLIVDPVIYTSIQTSISRFQTDLTNDGYNVILCTTLFSSPEGVRTYLQSLYSSTTPKLTGTILIGDIPLAKQRYKVTFTNPNIPTQYYMGVTTQFYSDLDGEFKKDDSMYPTYYTSHTGEIYSEIWVSVIPKYKNDNALTADRINKYFEKNHKYRTGELPIHTGFLDINEHHSATNLNEYNDNISAMISGQYAWIPFTTWGNASQYIWNSIGKPDVKYAIDNEYGSVKYGFCAHAAHGLPTANGSINTDWVLSHALGMIFLYLDGCNVGDLEDINNISVAALYSSLSNVLLVKGATTESGGLGSNANGYYGKNLATSMMNGKSMGEAFIEHNRTPLLSPWSLNFEQHYMPTIFFGDLTLKINNLVPIDRPIPIQPGKNAVTPQNVTLSWSEFKNINAYRLQVATNSQFSNLVKDTIVASCSCSISGLLNNNIYYWKVCVYNQGQSPIWSAVFNFTSTTNIIVKPELMEPTNNSENHQLTVLLKWKKAISASSYQLQLSESSTFASFVKDTSNLTDSSLIVSNLSPAKYYYWRLRAKNGSLVSEWSTIFSFKTYNLPLPSTPRPQYPGTGASGICINPYFSWGSVETAGFYRLQISDKVDFSTRTKDIGSIAMTRLKVSGLSPDVTYYWRVNATNSTGTSAWSDIYNFKTSSNAPPKSILVSPPQNSTVKLITPPSMVKFVWSKSIDPDIGDSIKYTITVTGTGVNKIQSNIVDTSIYLDIMGGMRTNTRYDWYVEATDGLFRVQSTSQSYYTSSSITSIEQDNINQPFSFRLNQNYPNPFNPGTIITFEIPEDGFVTLEIFNTLGQKVDNIFEKYLRRGNHKIEWNPSDLPSGTYFYRLSNNKSVLIKKLLYLR